MIELEYSDFKKEITATANELISSNYDSNRNAFIGRLSTDDQYTLFLVCRNCVLLAENPNHVFYSNQVFAIAEFVDVKITIKDK